VARQNILRWKDGRGWLVLSGGADAESEIRALALGRVAADGGVAYVSIGDQGEQTLADMEDLGAPSGYLVDILAEDDQTVQKQLADAGMIVVEGGAHITDIRSALLGAAVEGMQAAFANGAVILVEGLSAMVFGEWVALESGKLLDGLGWLESALIVPGITSVSESEPAQVVLVAQPTGLAIGIGVGSALALGPDGEVETWGRRQVTVALGGEYSR
jgi:hypothetical protein